MRGTRRTFLQVLTAIPVIGGLIALLSPLFRYLKPNDGPWQIFTIAPDQPKGGAQVVGTTRALQKPWDFFYFTYVQKFVQYDPTGYKAANIPGVAVRLRTKVKFANLQGYVGNLEETDIVLFSRICPHLGCIFNMDEAYVGGKTRGRLGRGSPNKEVVVGIRKRNGELRFFYASDVKSGTLAKFIQENVSEDVEVLMTDDFNAYKRATKHLGPKHQTIKHSEGVYVDGDIHTNSIESAFSLLKRGIIGTWHKISAKHLGAYLDEDIQIQPPEAGRFVPRYVTW